MIKSLMRSVISMGYRVIIMPPAKRRLDMYVFYTVETLGNRQAAKAILADARETKKRLYRIMKGFLQTSFIYGSVIYGSELLRETEYG